MKQNYWQNCQGPLGYILFVFVEQGAPTYKYQSEGNGQIAIVTLPDGQRFKGHLSKNKEEVIYIQIIIIILNYHKFD